MQPVGPLPPSAGAIILHRYITMGPNAGFSDHAPQFARSARVGLPTRLKRLVKIGRGSLFSYRSMWSVLSASSVLSVASAASLLSIGSFASILSIGSSNSVLSIGSDGGFLSIGRSRRPR
jgi:hypothetical protein